MSQTLFLREMYSSYRFLEIGSSVFVIVWGNIISEWRHIYIYFIGFLVYHFGEHNLAFNCLQIKNRGLRNPPWVQTPSGRTSDYVMTWWRHQMDTFSALLAMCAGNSPAPVTSPHKGQWRGALMFSLICTRINGWVNNGEAGDLRRHHAHCDVTVMKKEQTQVSVLWVLYGAFAIFHCRFSPLRWRHNGHDCVSNHQPHNCLLSPLFGRRSK